MRTFLTGVLVTLLAGTGSLFGQTVDVRPEDGLNAAIDFANGGNADTLRLITDGGVYELAPVEILVPMVIMAAEGLTTQPTIKAAAGIDQNDYITVDNDLEVWGVTIDGQTMAGDYAQYKYMFKVNNVPDDSPINEAPSLTVMNSHLKNVYANGDPVNDTDGNFFDISRTSYAAKVHFENTTLENSGDEGIRSINAHKDPVHPNGTAIGDLTIKNCTFININGSAVKIESDGDPDSFDGNVLIENVTFYNCLRRVIWERDIVNSVYRNLIIANSKIGNDTFAGTDALISMQRMGSVISHVDTFAVVKTTDTDTVTLGSQAFVNEGGRWSGAPDVGDVHWTTVYGFDPMFADAENGDFTLMEGSKAYGRAHDGGALGDRRWATNPPAAKTTIFVRPEDGLTAAIEFANGGNADTIVLTVSGDEAAYDLSPVRIMHPMVIMADPALPQTSPPVIKAAADIDQNDFIRVDEDLTIYGVSIDGQSSAGTYAKFKYMFKINNVPDDSPINDAPYLTVKNATLSNVYRNGDPDNDEDGNFLDIQRTGYGGGLLFEGVTFRNSGDEGLRSINAHKDPVHPQNGGFRAFVVRNCTFDNINGSAIKIESDGDSLTADAPVLVENVTFNNCQRRVIWERDFEYSIYRNLIIANSKTGNDTFGGSDVLIDFQRRGSTVAHVDTFNVQKVADGDTVTLGPQPFFTTGGRWSGSSDPGTVDEATIYGFDPLFADAANGDFTLLAGSEAYGKGHDGGALGDRRWAVNAPATAVEEDLISSLPQDYKLEQNYPNPFNPTTTIQYSLKAASVVQLAVYDITGRVVETLVDQRRAAGTHSVQWIPNRISSGVYFYRLQVDGRVVKTRKMTLLK